MRISNLKSQISNRRAFTLIEVILAVALSVLLFGGMIWFYQYTAEVRQDTTRKIEKIQARRLLLDRFTDQLRAATKAASFDLAMEGQVDSIRFVTTSLPPPASYNEYDMTEDPPSPQLDAVVASYKLDVAEDEDGRVKVVRGIQAGVQRLLSATLIEEEKPEEDPKAQGAKKEEEADPEMKPEIETSLMSPHFKFIRFGYFDGTKWAETWPPGELPRAVEVAIGERELPEGVEPREYPYELHRRVIHVHAARRKSLQ